MLFRARQRLEFTQYTAGPWAQQHADLVVALALFLFALGCYAHALSAELLLSWDDSDYVTGNPLIRTLSPAALWRMWSQFYYSHYIPVTLMSYALDYQLWGLNPLGYHLTNVLLHALNGVFVYVVCQRLQPSRFVAGLAAVLFIMHPVQVESVAWVSERKNVLSLFFFLLAMLAHMRSRTAEAQWYTSWLARGCYVLALFAKPIVVGAPLLFMAYDVYWAGYSRRRAILVNLPLLGLGLLEAILTVQAVWGSTPSKLYWGNSPWLTALLMLRICWEYMMSLVAPLNLNVRYVYKVADLAGDIRIWLGVGVLGLLALVAWRQPFGKPLSRFAILWVVVFFLPVANIIPFTIQRADRYLYLPSIALFLLSAVGVHGVCQRLPSPRARCLLGVGLVALLLPLLILTVERTKVWANSGSLWQDHLADYPDSVNGLLNLGIYDFEQQAYAQAEQTFRQILPYNPKFAKAYYYLARCASKTGRYTEAISRYREALQLQPREKVYYNNMGYAFFQLKRYPEAIAAYKEALALAPKYTRARINLADAALRLRDFALARETFEALLRRRPRHFWATFGLCQTFVGLEDFASAEPRCQQAVRLQPRHARSLEHLAYVLLRLHRPMAALPWAKRAVTVAPKWARGYHTLGDVYVALGETAQAQDTYRTAMEINPTNRHVRQKLERLASPRQDGDREAPVDVSGKQP